MSYDLVAGAMIETDVLIVGSGPAGSSSALFLSTYGVRNMVITKYRWTANTPRAHITNQRAVEIMRDMGLEGEIKAKGVPQPLMGDTVFCTSLAGDELARLHTWGTHPQRLADYTLASPCIHYDLPQDIFEPIILGEAARRGSRVRFDTEYLSHVQDADGVTVTVLDRIGGERYEIRAKYLIGADGGRSKIAQDIGLPMEGEMDWAGSMNIVFHADLSKYVAHRPSVLYWIMQPGADIGGIGMGLVRMVRPWDEWLIVWGYDINEPPPERRRGGRHARRAQPRGRRHDRRHAAQRPRCGATTRCTPSATSRAACSAWATPATGTRRATAWARTRRSPTPTTSPGSSRSCSTARRRRRCWTPTTPSARRSASRSCCARTRASRSSGRSSTRSACSARPTPSRCGPTWRSARRTRRAAPRRARKLKAAIELKNYEFNAHGVELGHRYRSDAVVPDGTPEPEYTRDPELYYHPTTWPGARLPHAWLEHRGAQGLHARPRRQGPLHALHRHRRRGLGGGRGGR